MTVLATFPGRFGDLLWALPSCRALAEQGGSPVDLVLGGEFASILPLLRLQPYLQTVEALPDWHLVPPDEWKAPLAEAQRQVYDQVVDLGYRGWPDRPLPQAIAAQAGIAIDLTRPWIATPAGNGVQGLRGQIGGGTTPPVVAIGFTEAYFELKVGLVHLWDPHLPPYAVLTPPGSRWQTERPVGSYPLRPCTWLEAAGIIRGANLFVGDCSALHVLAVGLGKPVLLCEPMEARWNSIFYPLGMDGPQVTVVRGNDSRPSFDARACADAIREALR
jgi:hypothetical protein